MQMVKLSEVQKCKSPLDNFQMVIFSESEFYNSRSHLFQEFFGLIGIHQTNQTAPEFFKIVCSSECTYFCIVFLYQVLFHPRIQSNHIFSPFDLQTNKPKHLHHKIRSRAIVLKKKGESEFSTCFPVNIDKFVSIFPDIKKTVYCSFHWTRWRLKTNYYTQNVSRIFLLFSHFEKRRGHKKYDNS